MHSDKTAVALLAWELSLLQDHKMASCTIVSESSEIIDSTGLDFQHQSDCQQAVAPCDMPKRTLSLFSFPWQALLAQNHE